MFRLPMFGSNSHSLETSDRDTLSGGVSRVDHPPRAGLFILFLFALLSSAFSPTTPLIAQQQEYVVEIGDVTVLPGTSLVEIPVYITNEEPLTFWQMGLDYDNLLLNISAVTTKGTVSEPLAPQVTPTMVGSLIYGVEVDYSNGAELPAGNRQLALYLLVSLVNPTQAPTGSTFSSREYTASLVR